MTNLYAPREPADIARLVADYPLAWLISRDFHASPLPLIAETDDSGVVVSLFGHCARRNPLVADFRADPRGLILFNGPAGYIPTTLLSKPDWAPTWNYAVLRFTVEVEFVEHETRDAIEQLVDKMEDGAWSTSSLGGRYDTMLDQIIAFRAHVRSAEHSFKLGQDESPQGFAEIVAGHADPALVKWMEGQART
ncbi:negative transcriptional regulator, PaiB family [Sphingopyxis sp. YR583]|jgi:transcriptional regulator|uniref:FMN-binding negative transcriptional regulator n=1 Tax=Sphingopyxis sp. YR583 TaxID=1881047 RepID=UPI0008A7DDDD|nr:FMN-binding negative transcriptional regulator [Sphingopyxis sp. YR583]SEH20225.1 negative transcriptional regulator, PaiB family [Sphingopyxis sp. YR583]